MNALAHYNRCRAEADKLPGPTMHGERCVSPKGLAFQAVECVYACEGRVTLAWELCAREWTPLGILFRETPFPPVR